MYSNQGGGSRNILKSLTGLNAISCLVKVIELLQGQYWRNIGYVLILQVRPA